MRRENELSLEQASAISELRFCVEGIAKCMTSPDQVESQRIKCEQLGVPAEDIAAELDRRI